jgi:hypothetical protein
MTRRLLVSWAGVTTCASTDETSSRRFSDNCICALSNKGFSSTDGVLIALSRFDQLKIKPVKGPNGQVAEVDIGPGLSWDQVYAQVVPQGVNVLGGRFATVGVSGLLLGA